jgi:hypothetical protein
MSSRTQKIPWSGRILAVQPRIRLWRSFDERGHSYLGYVLRIDRVFDGQAGEALVAVGKAAHEKHQFQAGMEFKGQSVPVQDPRKEVAKLYRTSGLKLIREALDPQPAGPPFLGIPPDLETYRDRGHLRLDARTYVAKCSTCIWGCRMPVEMIIDPWNPSFRYRFETFCYGPKSCAFYRPGPARKVPGRKGMTYTEEDWVDEDATAHRDLDD